MKTILIAFATAIVLSAAPSSRAEEKSLNVAVMGSGSTVTFSGSYVYVKGGKDFAGDLGGTGNRSEAFWGDCVKSCTVRKTSNAGEIKLVISEGEQTVFKSPWVGTNEPIVYERPTTSSSEEILLVADVKQAFAKHDTDALMSLSCWDRVPEKFKMSARRQYGRDVEETVSDIVLTDPDPNYPDMVWKDKDGVSYSSNLRVIKQLKIIFATGSAFGEARYPVGRKDGKLCLLEPAPVKQ